MCLELDFCFKMDFCKFCIVIKSISSRRLPIIYRVFIFVHICNSTDLDGALAFDLTINSVDAVVWNSCEGKAGSQKTGLTM